MTNRKEVNEFIDRLTKEATDKGKLIEVGWLSLRKMVIPEDAPEVQLREMHYAFFAGAQHVFASLMAILDPGEEPTARDLARVSAISRELDIFVSEVKAAASQKPKSEMN